MSAADTFAHLDAVLLDMLAQLSPQQRTRALRDIGNALRRGNAARIAANITPEGAAFAPRKKQKKKKGIPLKRGKLFKKIHLNRSLHVKASSHVEIGFDGFAAHIAQVNHYGLADKVREGLTALYPRRELLGITESDKHTLRDVINKHLKP